MKRLLVGVILVLVGVNSALLAILTVPFPAKQSSYAHQPITLLCPVPPTYCAGFVPVYRTGADKKPAFYGFGWRLPEKTPIYSVFAGPLYPVRANLYPGYGQPGLLLEQAPGKQVRATYVFSGDDVIRYTAVRVAGEELLHARSLPVADTNVNLIIRLSRTANGKTSLLLPEQVVFKAL